MDPKNQVSPRHMSTVCLTTNFGGRGRGYLVLSKLVFFVRSDEETDGLRALGTVLVLLMRHLSLGSSCLIQSSSSYALGTNYESHADVNKAASSLWAAPALFSHVNTGLPIDHRWLSSLWRRARKMLP